MRYFIRRFKALSPAGRTVLLLAAFVCVSSAVAWAPLPSIYRSTGPWHPYHVVSTAVAAVDAVARLEAAGALEIITPATTEVLVTRFSHVERMPLAAAMNLLDELDPRLDPFIRGLPAYFNAESDERSLIYFRAPGGVFRARRLVRSALGPDARVLWTREILRACALLLFVAGAIAAWTVRRNHGLALVAIAVVWFPRVMTGGLESGMAAGLVLLAWGAGLPDVQSLAVIVAGRRMARAPERARHPVSAGLWPVAVTILTLPFIGLVSGSAGLVTGLIAVLGTFAAVAIWCVIGTAGRVNTDHSLFEPISLFTGTAVASTGFEVLRSRTLFSWIAFFAALLVPAGILSWDSLQSESAPVPVQTIDAHLSAESLAEHAAERSPAGLVDLADLAAHAAYQEALVYGWSYRLPTPGETVELVRFSESDDGSYEQFSETVIRFDDTWFDGVFQDPPAGIGRMLAALQSPAGVVWGLKPGLYSIYPQVIQHMVYVVLVFAPVVVFGRRIPSVTRRQSRVFEISRRRQQVA